MERAMGLERRITAAVSRGAEIFAHAWRKLATVAVLLLAVLVGYHVVFGANGMLVYQKKRAEYRTLERQVERMQKDNQALADQVKALQSDPKAIEKEAREQLRYARPGEVIYLLPGKPAPHAPADATAQKR
jgi:cell division protein FtsB